MEPDEQQVKSRDARTFGFDRMLYRPGAVHSHLFTLKTTDESGEQPKTLKFMDLEAHVRVAANARKDIVLEQANGSSVRVAFIKI